MQNQQRKTVRMKLSSRWSYSTSSLYYSPCFMTHNADCTTLPVFQEKFYVR